jgi:hypothetical protein
VIVKQRLTLGFQREMVNFIPTNHPSACIPYFFESEGMRSAYDSFNTVGRSQLK